MKKQYIAPTMEVTGLGARHSLLASSYIHIGGGTDEFDTKRAGDWDIWGNDAAEDSGDSGFDF